MIASDFTSDWRVSGETVAASFTSCTPSITPATAAMDLAGAGREGARSDVTHDVAVCSASRSTRAVAARSESPAVQLHSRRTLCRIRFH